MEFNKGLVVVASFLMTIGCGSTSSEPPPTTVTTSDFFHLAIVPDQTVSTATFEVQVIAENINPTTPPNAPQVIDGSGISHTMAPKTLKWPRIVPAEDSVTIWSATIPLVSDQVNNIKVVSGTKELTFSIRHKTTLSVRTASDATQLVSHIKAAITDPTIDVIEVAYNEPDLGSTIGSPTNPAGRNSGNNILNNRTTWLTIKPAVGNTISWVKNSGAPTGRPFVDFLHLSTVTFGSDLSDYGGGSYTVESNHRVWLSNVEFRGKYKYTWSKDTPITAITGADVRTNQLQQLTGQKVYFTDCLWDGTASVAATSIVQLARDLHFNSHRGDINNFGKVFLNASAQDIETIRNFENLDYLHNDGFQIWGNMGTNNLVFKGLKIFSPNIPADIQPFLLDRADVPDYSYILMDSVIIVGAAPGTVVQAQVAGKISNSRISNISFPNQNITFRQDFTETNGALNPTNVYISNLEVKKVLYGAPIGSPSMTYDSTNVTDPNNISNELRANPGLSGISFSNIKVSPQ